MGKYRRWAPSQGTTVLETPCREFQGARHKFGYGRRSGSRPALLHRWVWEQVNGPIPPGMHVLHRCDNPPCFRYDHLFLGTIADNQRDMVNKNRSRRGARHGMAKLDDQQIAEVRAVYALGGTSHRRLAKQYGVSHAHIKMIVNMTTRVPTTEGEM